ncbi:MAG: DUF5671 domain-containing protein [Dehalococcoidia bacterium]|nr:DUF5671 domain-containing protein [Dehalococcoidia bacterium]
MIGSVIVPVVVVLALAAVAAAVVFFAVKLRSGEALSIPFRSLLVAYFYLLSAAGFIVLMIGLSGLLNTGLSSVLGRDFGYTRPFKAMPAAIAVPPEGLPGKAVPVAPTTEEQQKQAEQQQDRQFREGLLQGISMFLVGGLVWALHALGRRRTETAVERESGFLHMAYLAVLLVICSLVGMISLASGVFDTLRFYLLSPPDQFSYMTPPGQNASVALVFTPAWAYYLVSLLRAVRQRHQA